MCGIVGLFLKNPALEPELGRHLSVMMIAMSDRGPDSAGIALYGASDQQGGRLTLFHPDTSYDWAGFASALSTALGDKATLTTKGNHAIVALQGETAPARAWIKANRPELRVMGYGKAMDVFKDMGLPAAVSARYDLPHAQGTHGICHTRMATESAVTTEHSHPFTAADDMCLVHNGSLSNHNRLREWLRRRGQEFETDNDSEVAARYFAHRLGEGATLTEALEAGLKDLDGFYTFAMGTRDGFAVLRDGVACKPAVLAETDDWVAMSSEYRGLADLPGVEKARLWEPEPSKVYVWEKSARVTTIDLAETKLRELNKRLHALPPGTNERQWQIVNPRGAHSVAVGLDAPVEVTIDGHVGYYCAGMNKQASVTINGQCGWGVAENIMSGVVRVRGNASQSAAASGRGGLVVIEGDASARCGISMKGVDIVVGGSVGHMSAFMAQRGNLVVCGDAGADLGDSIYEANLYVAGTVASLGADCEEKKMTAADVKTVAALLERAGIKADAKKFKRYGSARNLYHFKVDHAAAY